MSVPHPLPENSPAKRYVTCLARLSDEHARLTYLLVSSPYTHIPGQPVAYPGGITAFIDAYERTAATTWLLNHQTVALTLTLVLERNVPTSEAVLAAADILNAPA